MTLKTIIKHLLYSMMLVESNSCDCYMITQLLIEYGALLISYFDAYASFGKNVVF